MGSKIDKKDIPEEVLGITSVLKDAKYEAYLVGGCVRDLIMGNKPKDWDITTNAKPEEILELFGERAFYENDFGTVGIKNKESDDTTLSVVEITPYRLESKYSDSRHPDKVVFSEKLEDDLKRRDFTINALAYSPDQDRLVDEYNGLKDIKDKIIKTVGKAEDRFSEDALRMLRAVRFAAELEFSMDSELTSAINVSQETLKMISRERIGEEFERIIMSDNPLLGLSLAQKVGLLTHIAPDLEEMVGVDQNKEAHKFDVWEHSLRSLQHAADKEFSREIRLAALFHDIAKPTTKREKGGKTTFFGHEVVGERMTRKSLENLKFSRETIDKVTMFVRWHMFFSDPDEITLTAVRRMIARVKEENIWDLVNLRICDRIGTGRPKEEPYRLRKYKSMIDEALKDPVSLKKMKINGDIMVGDMDMKPGKRMGDILYALFNEVLDDPGKNDLEYLKSRALELDKLSDEELKKLGDEGKVVLKDERGREIKKIRSKHGVS